MIFLEETNLVIFSFSARQVLMATLKLVMCVLLNVHLKSTSNLGQHQSLKLPMELIKIVIKMVEAKINYVLLTTSKAKFQWIHFNHIYVDSFWNHLIQKGSNVTVEQFTRRMKERAIGSIRQYFLEWAFTIKLSLICWAIQKYPILLIVGTKLTYSWIGALKIQLSFLMVNLLPTQNFIQLNAINKKLAIKDL